MDSAEERVSVSREGEQNEGFGATQEQPNGHSGRLLACKGSG